MSPVERMTIDKIHTLPTDLQQQILAFAEFIELRAKSNLDANIQASTDLTAGNKRQGFGLWKGAITIHDDFDEPLADFEEYM
ncbi:DUF2281 domain-containing protein [Chamaesiphon sp.]|uniref:type II toxin-antitoxin system VapB family antitoxin n=1 Tax=Chamaesiphon sp. TaxID=2814140 RepID=UPI0035938D40